MSGYRKSAPRRSRLFGGAQLPDPQALHQEIGAKLAGFLVCRTCDRRQNCSGTDASHYLGHGWPKCCGKTMELRSAAQSTAEIIGREVGKGGRS